MKATFHIPKDNEIKQQLQTIAEKYNTTVHLDDDDISHFILVEPKLQIKQRVREDKYIINVWGATQDDIDYFKEFWGEPVRTEKQRLSPLEFAQELVAIPNIHQKSKQEIMELMELDERFYNRYQKLIDNQLRRSEPDKVFIKASEILKKE